jgi:HSP90 family molecular chaperone
MMKEDMNVHLYSRNIVIKKNCTELLPHFLRFVCGIVDCEDLPLNVSRENYQDTAFMAKLKSIIAKRLITEIQNEANRDPTKYLGWYEQYQFYLKEGIASEPTYAEQLMPLLRFQHNTGDGYISLDEYIKKLQPGQDTIYFLSAPTRELALRSPYLEPFRGSDVPVLLSYIHIDEMVFTSVNAYKNFKFVSNAYPYRRSTSRTSRRTS